MKYEKFEQGIFCNKLNVILGYSVILISRQGPLLPSTGSLIASDFWSLHGRDAGLYIDFHNGTIRGCLSLTTLQFWHEACENIGNSESLGMTVRAPLTLHTNQQGTTWCLARLITTLVSIRCLWLYWHNKLTLLSYELHGRLNHTSPNIKIKARQEVCFYKWKIKIPHG